MAIWEKVRGALGATVFQNWFEGMAALGFGIQNEPQKTVVEVRVLNAFAADRLRNKYQSVVQSVAEEVLGAGVSGAEVSVVFVVQENWQEGQEEVLAALADREKQAAQMAEFDEVSGYIPGFEPVPQQSRKRGKLNADADSAVAVEQKPLRKRGEKSHAGRSVCAMESAGDSSASKCDPGAQIQAFLAQMDDLFACGRVTKAAFVSGTTKAGGSARLAQSSTQSPTQSRKCPMAERTMAKRTSAESSSEKSTVAPVLTSLAPSNTRYGLFETFVVGKSNELAYTTVRSILTASGVCSPVILTGGPGVGKTHLLQAAWRAAPAFGLSVVYATAEEFMMEYVETFQFPNKKSEFAKTYRQCDLLILDNLQYLLTKTGTAGEFLRILAYRHRYGRQTLLSCDRPLDKLSAFGSDLCSHLKSGVWCRLAPPELEVRLGIVAQLAQRNQLPLDAATQNRIARQTTTDAREILGIMNTLLLATRHDLRHDLRSDSRPDSHENGTILDQILTNVVPSASRIITLDQIKKAVAEHFDLDVATLSSGSRARRVTHPRMLAMFLARKYTRLPLSEIGRSFGCASHSTVISAQKKVSTWLSTDAPLPTPTHPTRATLLLATLESALGVGV